MTITDPKRSAASALAGVVLLGLGACDRAPAPIEPAAGGGAVTEYTALLANLEAIRRDVNELRTDIAVLRTELNARPAPAPAPAPAAVPAPPPAAALVTELELDADDPVLGDENATLAIVEFTDYECPFCRRFNDQTLSSLVDSYVDTGKVQLITRDLPLSFHPNAMDAALAANCAAAQGAYESMRAGIFANQQALGSELYAKLADDDGLDVVALEACMQDADYRAEIEADASYAASIGVTGTPSFFIGRVEDGKLVDASSLVGALPPASFSEIIDALL